MDYVVYVLVTLVILLVCLTVMRIPGRSRLNKGAVALSRKAQRRAKHEQIEKSGTGIKNRQEILQRELSKVPTPWGWPGKQGKAGLRRYGSIEAHEDHGPGETLHQIVEKLTRTKRSAHSDEYRQQRNECLKSMLEDRYGRTPKPAEVEYRKVKAPLLRDPAAPHDQMDNFPSGKTSQIAAQIKKNSRTGPTKTQVYRPSNLTEIRKPVGW